ncbi:MAG: hypothetical protein WCX61_03560 [Candidatus Peribacteraceae bacterium]
MRLSTFLFAGICAITTELLFAPSAQGAEQIPHCSGGNDPGIDAILGVDKEFLTILEPISDHFTRKVLDRAEAGIQAAEGYESKLGDDTVANAIPNVFGSFGEIADTELRIVQHERDLKEVTPCLHIDLFLIETMMEKVRCKLQGAYDDKKMGTILELQNILRFLNERFDVLLFSAKNNTHEDTDMWTPQSFDPELIWCCRGGKISCEPFWLRPGGPSAGELCPSQSFDSMEECLENSQCVEWKMCPFHSDYLPPSLVASSDERSGSSGKSSSSQSSQSNARGDVYGYGCDLEVLEKAWRGLEKVNQKYSSSNLSPPRVYLAFKAEYEALKELFSERDEFIEDSMSIKSTAEHLDEWMGREPTEGLEFFGMTTEKNREHRVRVACNAEDGIRGAPPPALPEDEEDRDPEEDYWPPMWPEGAIRWSTHDSFAIDKNEFKLLREYENLRDVWARNREQWYELPEEYGLLYIFQSYVRTYLLRWSIYQEQLISTIIPQGVDPPKQVVEEFRPIRLAVSELATYAASLDGDGEKGSIRSFARGLAYYLRRSCFKRPCNDRLERILKIVLKDECFPYTNGGISVAKPWEKCKKAAKLDDAE